MKRAKRAPVTYKIAQSETECDMSQAVAGVADIVVHSLLNPAASIESPLTDSEESLENSDSFPPGVPFAKGPDYDSGTPL